MSRFFTYPLSVSSIRHRADQVVFAALFLVAAMCAVPSSVSAQNISSSRSYEVHNDRGGMLNTRIIEIQSLRRTGQRIRITGSVCQSTCTMFLGLAQTCVSPETEFGFHGPSSFGLPLSQPVFDQASQIIANHYPDPLKQWYMAEARHSLWGMHRITGAQMIAWGITRPCQP